MQVLCCHTTLGLREETKQALLNFAPGVEFVDVTGDRYAYWREINKRWNGTEDLMLVEHDNVITADVVPSFEACDSPWCAYGYTALPHHGRATGCLGCTKFSAELQRKHPFSVICEDKALTWSLLDVTIGRFLHLEGGIEPCDHGSVEHLHEYIPMVHPEFNERGEYTSDTFGYFMPPLLRDCGNKAIWGSPLEKYFNGNIHPGDKFGHGPADSEGLAYAMPADGKDLHDPDDSKQAVPTWWVEYHKGVNQ